MKQIAEETIFGRRQAGERFDVHIEVGVPYQWGDDPNEWACPVSMRPLHSELRDIHGGSSLQALCLALSLAKSLLEGFLQSGGQLTYETGENFAIDAVFGTTKVR